MTGSRFLVLGTVQGVEQSVRAYAWWSGSTSGSRPLHRLESLIPLAAAALITAIAQRWSGLDTPDSSFYASLALFGDEVTDRAPFTSYYWTRLGYIAPVGLLTGLLGSFPGFLAYKDILLMDYTLA